jgi:phosphatidylglycerophosphate synthase
MCSDGRRYPERAMLDKTLRGPKEMMLAPIASRWFARVDPTTVTLLAFGAGVAASVAAWQQAYSVGVGLWIANRVLDGLDGTVARVHGKQSELGAYLDILLDTAIYALIPSAIVLGAPSEAGWLSLLVLLISFYMNASSWMYLAALLEKRNLGARARGELTTITMPSGLVEGSETVLLFTLFLLFPAAHVPLFLLMAVLVFATIAQRLIWARQHL